MAQSSFSFLSSVPVSSLAFIGCGYHSWSHAPAGSWLAPSGGLCLGFHGVGRFSLAAVAVRLARSLGVSFTVSAPFPGSVYVIVQVS